MKSERSAVGAEVCRLERLTLLNVQESTRVEALVWTSHRIGTK